MNTRQKALRTGAIFIAVLIVAGLLLLYKGNDAVAIGMEKKEGILTAEQVKMSFDSVSGRLLKEAVKEGGTVKAGDVIMELDSTDTDLSIERTKAQIAQLDAQIRSTGGTQSVNYQKADSDEQQSFRQIDQQRAAVSAAQATLKNSQIDYNRKSALLDAGAIAKSQLDDAEMALNVAEANVTQQQQLLDKLLSGAQDTGNTDSISLPTIAQQREAAGNMSNDIDARAASSRSSRRRARWSPLARLSCSWRATAATTTSTSARSKRRAYLRAIQSRAARSRATSLCRGRSVS